MNWMWNVRSNDGAMNGLEFVAPRRANLGVGMVFQHFNLLADVLPRHLSGGQQQRVAIARALAPRPRVLLLDEPTSALDPELVHEVLEVIRRLAVDDGLTMIIITHQLRFAMEIADRVAFMNDYEVFNAAYTSWFRGPLPSRTCVGVTALAAGAAVEIDLIAGIPAPALSESDDA